MTPNNGSFELVTAQMQSIKELMAANFKTVQVQLDTVAAMAPDVEALKNDMTEVKTALASHSAHVTSLENAINHVEKDYMRRDEIHETFVKKAELNAGKAFVINKWMAVAGGSGVVVSITMGVLQLILGH